MTFNDGRSFSTDVLKYSRTFYKDVRIYKKANLSINLLDLIGLYFPILQDISDTPFSLFDKRSDSCYFDCGPYGNIRRIIV